MDFIDGERKRVGNVSLQSPTIAAFNANAAEALAAAMVHQNGSGDAERNNARETYYAQLKCHDSRPGRMPCPHRDERGRLPLFSSR